MAITRLSSLNDIREELGQIVEDFLENTTPYGDIQLIDSLEHVISWVEDLASHGESSRALEIATLIMESLHRNYARGELVEDEVTVVASDVVKLISDVVVPYQVTMSAKEFFFEVMVKWLQKDHDRHVRESVYFATIEMAVTDEEKKKLLRSADKLLGIPDLCSKTKIRLLRKNPDLLWLYVELIPELGLTEEQKCLEEHFFTFNEDLCFSYIQRLSEDNNQPKALDALNQYKVLNGKIPDNCSGIYLQLIKMMHPSKHQEELLESFLRNNDWDAFNELKEFVRAEEWLKLRENIVETFIKPSGKVPQEQKQKFLEEEHLFQPNVAAVQKLDDLNSLEQHARKTKFLPSHHLFIVFCDALTKFTNSFTGEKHYERVVLYLKVLKRISPSKELFKKYLSMLTESNKRRKTLVAKISQL